MMLPIDYAKQFISKALALHNEHANETRVRDNFTSYLRNMFPDNPKWVNYHIEGAEPMSIWFVAIDKYLVLLIIVLTASL